MACACYIKPIPSAKRQNRNSRASEIFKRCNLISQIKSTNSLGSSVLTGRKIRKLINVTNLRCQVEEFTISLFYLSLNGFLYLQRAQSSIGFLFLLVLEWQEKSWTWKNSSRYFNDFHCLWSGHYGCIKSFLFGGKFVWYGSCFPNFDQCLCLRVNLGVCGVMIWDEENLNIQYSVISNCHKSV